ncbi:hypothetical protein [Yoonia vestfoldensis]|uniref:hypothetical protein n=1 Tax=Yoonia vestfoldensis TaxID=245188 RepID=UPI0013A5B7DD|nr:hypothetical protein [Yoonia vestfoldensis]
MDLDEVSERRYLEMLIALLLKRAFANSSEFEHSCMSAGEALGACFEHFGAARNDGWKIRLTMPKDWILNKVRLAPMRDLPTSSDVLDVLLTFLSQYGTVPNLTDPFKSADFDPEVSGVLQEMRLIDG